MVSPATALALLTGGCCWYIAAAPLRRWWRVVSFKQVTTLLRCAWGYIQPPKPRSKMRGPAAP